jgi:hypothetical protein
VGARVIYTFEMQSVASIYYRGIYRKRRDVEAKVRFSRRQSVVGVDVIHGIVGGLENTWTVCQRFENNDPLFHEAHQRSVLRKCIENAVRTPVGDADVKMNMRTSGGEVRLELDQRGPVQTAKRVDICIRPVQAEDDVWNVWCRSDELHNRGECETGCRVFAREYQCGDGKALQALVSGKCERKFQIVTYPMAEPY